MLKFILFNIGILYFGPVYAARDLQFLNSNQAKISISEKSFGNFRDKVFVDSFNREAYFRGWNVSNTAKGSPFLVFKNNKNSGPILIDLKIRTGSNILRWLISWKGINPAVDVIDHTFLKETIKSLKQAIALGFYILIDWHQDLFGSIPPGIGNGAPAWVTDGMHLPKGKCEFIINKCLSWSQNYFTNKAVKAANRNFWNNIKIKTKKGKRYIQDEFIWQMKRTLKFFKKNLSQKEWNHIIGIDPWNEPSDGGLRNYDPRLSSAEWHQEKLWPFYKKIRSMMDLIGYGDVPIFAEPNMIWNVNLPLVAPRGEGFLKDPPKKGFVFNAHSYDETREGFGTLSRVVKNGAYLKELDRFRNEGRYLGQVPFVSEFGAWGSEKGFDANRIIKATYQGMEISLTKKRWKFSDFYSPLISGTQWAWDFIEEKLIPNTPAMIDPKVIERAYPRRAQGDIISFYYNDMAKDSYRGKNLDWAEIKLHRKTYFSQNKFIYFVWRGRNSNAPTEIFIPRHFELDKTIVITEKKIVTDLSQIKSSPDGEMNELFKRADIPKTNDGGTRLFIYDDHDPRETDQHFHYAIIAQGHQKSSFKSMDLSKFQYLMWKKIMRKESPLFLRGAVRIEKPKKAYPYRK